MKNLILFIFLLGANLYSMEKKEPVVEVKTVQEVTIEEAIIYQWPMNSNADVIDAVLEYIDELSFLEKEQAIKKVRKWLSIQENKQEDTIAALQAEVNGSRSNPIILDNPDYVPQSIRFDN